MSLFKTKLTPEELEAKTATARRQATELNSQADKVVDPILTRVTNSMYTVGFLLGYTIVSAIVSISVYVYLLGC